MKQKEENCYHSAPRWALLLGTMGLLLAYFLIFTFPQRPDGDLTALTQFEALYGSSPLYQVRDSLWLNVAGALLAWGGIYYFLHYFIMISDLPFPVCFSSQAVPQWAPLLMWGGLLVMWSGWAWNQTRAWQGELFLEAGLPTPLGVDRTPIVTFERFLLPPAPDGPGRALALRLLVDECACAYEISEPNPYKGAGWTLKPRWYGVTAKSDALHQPLFFGESGTLRTALRGDEMATVTVNIKTLTVTSLPPLDDLQVAYHAILYARFAPGERLQWLGGVMIVVGALTHLLAKAVWVAP